MHVSHPLTRFTVHHHYIVNKQEVDHDLLEGEVPMSQAQQDAYKGIIGDGNAKVTLSRELSESSFGNGGKVFVSVTLTCDQSQQGLSAAVSLAQSCADHFIWQHHAELRNQLVSRGILKP